MQCTRARGRRVPRWPLLIIALGAFVSIWGGWVGLGELAGFGPVRLLPGIADSFVINSAITLPLGVEAYAAFAIWTVLRRTVQAFLTEERGPRRGPPTTGTGRCLASRSAG